MGQVKLIWLCVALTSIAFGLAMSIAITGLADQSAAAETCQKG